MGKQIPLAHTTHLSPLRSNSESQSDATHFGLTPQQTDGPAPRAAHETGILYDLVQLPRARDRFVISIISNARPPKSAAPEENTYHIRETYLPL